MREVVPDDDASPDIKRRLSLPLPTVMRCISRSHLRILISPTVSYLGSRPTPESAPRSQKEAPAPNVAATPSQSEAHGPALYSQPSPDLAEAVEEQLRGLSLLSIG